MAVAKPKDNLKVIKTMEMSLKRHSINMEKLTDRPLSTGSLVASPGINVDKTLGLHSATTVRLQRRHVGFTRLSRKGFFVSRVKHSSNSASTFQITRLRLFLVVTDLLNVQPATRRLLEIIAQWNATRVTEDYTSNVAK